MKLDEFLDVPDRPRFYGLLFVMLLELLALGPLENYVNRPERLPPTVVPCRHTNALCEPHAVQSSAIPWRPNMPPFSFDNAVGGTFT